MEFAISFLEARWNSDQNGNFKIFFYINSNCVFSKTIWWRKKSHDERSDELSISFLEPGGNSVQNDNVQLFCYISSDCVFFKTFFLHMIIVILVDFMCYPDPYRIHFMVFMQRIRILLNPQHCYFPYQVNILYLKVKCMELAEQLEEQGYSDETVEEKVATYRKQLLSKEVRML